MLWYKAWLETRARFCAGLAALLTLGAMIVLRWPEAGMGSDYPGYIRLSWFGSSLMIVAPLYAVMMGLGGIGRVGSCGVPGDDALFTLSLPVTRRRLLAVAAATGALEVAAFTVIPSLSILILSRLAGRDYAAAEVAIYSLLAVGGSLVFFFLAFLLSAVCRDSLWPGLIGFGTVIVLYLLPRSVRGLAPYNIYDVMRGESYFQHGTIPWAGLLVALLLAAAMFYGALRLVERRNY
jgi:hypothetical protein